MNDRLARFRELYLQHGDSGTSSSTELLLETMIPAEAQQLRLCAIPHEFNSEILCVLDPQLTAQNANELVSSFAELSLVINARQTLALHDDAREHLFNWWLDNKKHAEFAAISERLAAYHAAKIEATNGIAAKIHTQNRMFHMLGYDQQQGFAEFEQLFGLEPRMSVCEGLSRLVHEYDAVLSQEHRAWLNFYDGRVQANLRNWDEAKEFLEKALQQANGDLDLKARSTGWLGYIEAEQRNWGDAIELYKEALDVAENAADSEQLIALGMDYLSVAYRESGDLAKAEKYARQEIAIAESSEDSTGMARGYNSLGTAQFQVGDAPNAIEAYQKSLEALSASEQKFETAKVWNNLGNVFADNGRFSEAKDAFNSCLGVKKEAGDTMGQAIALNNLSRMYQKGSQLEDAVESQLTAISLLEDINAGFRLGMAKWNLGRLYRRRGSSALARNVLNEAREIFLRSNEDRKATAIEDELRSLDRKTPLPWWAITAIVVFSVMILLVFLALLWP